MPGSVKIGFAECEIDDELTAYLLFILDNNLDITKPKIKAFLLDFEGVLRTIKKINKPGK